MTARQKMLNTTVDNTAYDVYNRITKHSGRKLSTNPRHIIKQIFFF